MPISRITDWVASEAWKTWLASAESPTDASTAEKASKTGTPAATKAPNAISKITKVIGTDNFSAFWKSLSIVLLNSCVALAKPNSATVKPGLAC